MYYSVIAPSFLSISERADGFVYAPGTDPYPTDTLEYIIIGAASAIATSKSQQQTIDSAVQFLALLKSVNETLLSERLTQTFEDELNYSQIGTRRAPEYTSEVLLLSLSAGLKSAVYKDFAKVSWCAPLDACLTAVFSFLVCCFLA